MREGLTTDAELEQDFPALAVLYDSCTVGGRVYRRASRERLGLLGDRIGGDLVAAMRQQAVPGAYRAFARQIGLDPDGDGLPLEAMLMRRIRAGRFVPEDQMQDPCTVALLETGVPVWVADDASLDGKLTIGPLKDDDGARLPGTPAVPGNLAIWDAARPVALLLGDVAEDLVPTRRTDTVRLFALRVDGVPDASVREALWTASQLTGPAT